MSGKTDPQIALEILEALAVGDEEARRHLPEVLKGLERELRLAERQLREHGRILPGVAELLPRLHGISGVVQSVLTGNLAANALVKVAAFGLDRWLDLDVGAYGSDSHDRTELVPVALRKVEERDGRRFRSGEVWVIGDTPRDLECARAGGARCLLVATGRYELGKLEPLGADLVLPDLSDTETVAAALLDWARR